jgi:hypothetical protein
MNPKIYELKIQLDEIPKCLFWQGDKLVDPVRGKSFEILDSTPREKITVNLTDLHWRIGFDFDASVSKQIEDDQWLVLYQRRGTKAVILRNLKTVREIDRSYYHSFTHEFPVAIVVLPSGKAGIVHCPEEYCKIEIDDAETGERLTKRNGQGNESYFHSRLCVSPNGTKVCVGGWHWHPIEYGRFFEIAKIVASPSLLEKTAIIDQENSKDSEFDDIENIVFSDDNSVIASMQNSYNEESAFSQLRFWSPTTLSWTSEPKRCETLGLIYCKNDFAFSFYEHLKLVNVRTGEVATRWPDLKTGTQRGCYANLATTPVHAFDPVKFRLAIATEAGISLFYQI